MDFSSCRVVSTFTALQCKGVPLYLSDIFCCEWQEVDFVSEALGRLNGGDVGVDQHSLDILLLQSLDSLGKQTDRNMNITIKHWHVHRFMVLYCSFSN